VRLATLAAIALLVPALAAAQGRANGYGRGRGGPSTTGSAAPAVSTADGGFRQFGSWLDDASLLEPGMGWTAVSLGHFRSSWTRQTDFPVMDVGFGLTSRLQAGITIPYYQLSFVDGTHASGFGDLYLSAKVSLANPETQRAGWGLAVTPLVEILDTADAGGGRVSWAAPFTTELRTDRFRVFGSAGYFSRGAFFGGGALEAPVSDRVVLTTAFTHTRSTNDNLLVEALRTPQTRTDVTAVVAWFASSSVAIFGGVGRTFSIGDDTAMITAGLSWSFVPRFVQ
jgi:hypothetical protein